MTSGRLLVILAKVALSVFLASVFYAGWMAVAIATVKSGLGGLVAKVLLWIMAPVITGFGFALGPKTFDVMSSVANSGSFWTTYKWCLAGCAIGGGVVCVFGPMLIVFGMFVAGTLCVTVHEVIAAQEAQR